MNSPRRQPTRRSDLAKIHIAAKQLGMDDDTYRDALWSVCRVRSAKDLDAEGRREFLAYLEHCGFRPAKPKRATEGRPSDWGHPDKARLYRKIEAQLAEAKRPWSYALTILKRQAGVERFEWCDPRDLGHVIAALAGDAKRHGRPA